MKTRLIALLTLTAAALFSHSAAAAIIEDFRFNDGAGTLLGAAANSVNASNLWMVHANTVESAETAGGAFRIQKNSVTGQAANALEIANITSGKAWLVVDIASWLYTATASSTSERMRFAFMDNDPASTGGSTVTAEMNIDRSGAGLALKGDALGTGAAALGPTYALPLSQTNPLSIALEIDKTANNYTIYYKDGAAAWTALGTSTLGERSAGIIREGRSIRFAFTGQFGDTGELFDIDRIYLTTDNPTVPEPTCLALLGIAALGVFGRRQRLG